MFPSHCSGGASAAAAQASKPFKPYNLKLHVYIYILHSFLFVRASLEICLLLQPEQVGPISDVADR